MEGVFNLVPLVILAPIAGLLLNVWIGRKLSEKGVAWIACGAAGVSLVIAALLALALTQLPEGKIVPFIDWIKLPAVGVDIPWAFRVDTLSVTMMLVVSGVGTLIHIYAVGYMHGDERFARFFVYMNLFLASMLTLVSGNNFLVLFVGWELVGLCSFLLIGFWLHRDTPDPETGIIAGIKNSKAATKAFIVNRVGDFGFILALFLIWWTFGTLDYGPIVSAEHHAEQAAVGEVLEEEGEAEETTALAICQPTGEGVFPMVEAFMAGDCQVKIGDATFPIGTVITAITLLMLVGATGKSAQIPLFVWLPDAMAGPTPVSALIHAATMVTAGVYMVSRSNVLYEAARGVHVLPFGLTSPGVVTLIGSLTAFVAGTIALAQWDIKRVLAFSTISQLGFMMAAVGLGGYVAGMFHLTTHSFFKALLFLSAGSVIHGVEHGRHHAHARGEHERRTLGYREGVLDPQDMRNMGGLRRRMPITFWVYTIAAVAIAGIFPFAGFWSKDEIILDAYLRGSEQGDAIGWIAFILLIVAAVFTAFYMFRQVLMIFFGHPRTRAAHHAVESPAIITAPLVVLAFLSVVGGFLNVPGPHPFGTWLEQSVVHAHTADFNIALAVAALAIALAAIGLAYVIYFRRPLTVAGKDPLQRPLGPVWTFLNRKWYWDEAYLLGVVEPFKGIARFLGEKLDWEWWHDYFHERILYNGFNRITRFLGEKLDWEWWHDYFHESILYNGFNRITRFLGDEVDLSFIDGIVNGVGWVTERLAGVMRRLQTGYVRNYALSVLLGVVLVIIILLLPAALGQ
jgi:NADH-quinone oxidoreductase subunit L